MKKTEPLFTCDKCGQANFTARGLKSHNCARRIAEKTLVKHSPRPAEGSKREKTPAPGTLSSAVSPDAAFKDLTIPQLTEAAWDLEAAADKYERASGICATLQGLVILEVKEKIGHGKFMPWIKENFKKTHKTAARKMTLAKAFLGNLTGDVKFGLLSRSLRETLEDLEGCKLDLQNPTVAAVARWVDGRSSYQLMLELDGEEAKRRGGANNPDPSKRKSPSAALAEMTENTRKWAGEILAGYEFKKRLWMLLEDEEKTALASHLETEAEAIRAHLKIPKSKRAQSALEDFAV